MVWHDLLEKLKKLDEVTLLEVLDLSSEDIVDRFEDVIDLHQDKLYDWFDEDYEAD
jgi:hypothetical protein